MHIDAIRNVLLFTLQSQFAPMQLSVDGLSNQFTFHSEVKAVSQTIDSLDSSLELTNARLVCLEASNDIGSSNTDKFARD